MEEFLIILICLEIFEISWQKGTNFRDYISNLFGYYKKGVVFFILLHPTLYFILFAQMALQNYATLTSILVIIKVIDVGFKISLMDKIYNNKDLGNFEPLLKENYNIPVGMKFLGILLYPTLFFFAFS